MDTSKPWYESKVIWLAVLQMIAGIVVVLITKYPAVGWITVAKSIIDIMIRFATDLPIA